MLIRTTPLHVPFVLLFRSDRSCTCRFSWQVASQHSFTSTPVCSLAGQGQSSISNTSEAAIQVTIRVTRQPSHETTIRVTRQSFESLGSCPPVSPGPRQASESRSRDRVLRVSPTPPCMVAGCLLPHTAVTALMLMLCRMLQTRTHHQACVP